MYHSALTLGVGLREPEREGAMVAHMQRGDPDLVEQVVVQWREAFADAEGEQMLPLYAAVNSAAARGDWATLRPLLRIMRPMLLICSMTADQAGYGLERALEPTADGQTAEDLHTLAAGLRDALGPLHEVLVATNPTPGIGHGVAAGRPRRPVRTVDPTRGGWRGLLAVPAMFGVGLLIGVNTGLAATAEAARQWWQSTTTPNTHQRHEGT